MGCKPMNYKIVITALVLMAVMVPVLAGDEECDTVIEINATTDGTLSHSYTWPAGATFYALRAQTGNWASTTAWTRAFLSSSPDSGYYNQMNRGGLIFNTAQIPDDVTICNGTLSLYGYTAAYQTSNLGIINYSITDYSPATAGTLSTYDFDNTASVPYSADNVTVTNARVNWTLNAAAIANVSTTGYTNMMVRSFWDTFNSTSNLTWTDSKNTSARFYEVEDGISTEPVLRIAYNSTAGESGGFEGVSFTSNATEDMDPIAVVEFTDTSNVLEPISRLWEYLYVGTVYQPWWNDTSEAYESTATWHRFNTTSNQSTLTYAWGNGNYSIRLSITNATTTYISSGNYSFVNVSSGISGNNSWSGTYRFYPDDNIFYTNISQLPIHSKSEAWKTNLTAQSGAHPHMIYSQGFNTVREFVINDSFPTQPLLISSRQTFTDNRYEAPIPDDFWYRDQGTDKPARTLNFGNNISYSMGLLSHKFNGTWGGRLYIHNWSNNYNRFYPNNSFLGNDYIKDTDETPRTDTLQFWGPPMVGLPIFHIGLRYDEVASGTINHALNVIIPYAGNESSTLWPAINTGDGGERINCPAPGSYWRLNNSFDTSGLGTHAKVIAAALKKYGFVVTDNGASYGFQLYAVNDTRWNTTDLATIVDILISDTEAVDVSSLMIDRYSMHANTTPIASFTKNRIVVARPSLLIVNDTSVTSPALKTPTSYNWSWGDGTYSTTKNATHRYTRPGIFTVTLTASNEYGSDTDTSTVISIGRSDQQFSPFKDKRLFVNVEDGTFTASRDLSEKESDLVVCRMYGVNCS